MSKNTYLIEAQSHNLYFHFITNVFKPDCWLVSKICNDFLTRTCFTVAHLSGGNLRPNLLSPHLFQYKSKISDEMDLKRRIQSLEESMELHERMKRQALAEFESYRQRVEDMQLCTEAQVNEVCL